MHLRNRVFFLAAIVCFAVSAPASFCQLAQGEYRSELSPKEAIFTLPQRGKKEAGRLGLTRYEFSHPQMGTVFRLVFYTEKDSAQAVGIARKAFDAVDSLNASMSDYLPESELNRLCATAGSGQVLRVSDDLWQILKLSDGFSQKSKGAFDVTVGPLTRLWRRARNLKELPDSSRVGEARELVGFQNLVFKKGKKIELTKAGMRLDLGGIAQGYAADRCLKILRQNGISRVLADAGGDIALGDAPPGESGWAVEIPDNSEGLASSQALIKRTLRLSNCGITTSGAAFRYLDVGGKRYSHIVDPRTGWGLTHRVLATVQAPNATTADAWATAISVLGESGWKKLKQKKLRLRVWLTETKI